MELNEIRNRCIAAATAIKAADIFLLHIGAGFSADSGLPVYDSIADVPAYHQMNVSYGDLCRPEWLIQDPSVFYGFWGQCFNAYRNTLPHEGYNILEQWKEQYFKSNQEKGLEFYPNYFSKQWENYDMDVTHDPFFIVSSNVDSHPFKSGFSRNEVYEVHGSSETWQCSKAHFGCSKELYIPPPEFRFRVDTETMRADDISFNDIENEEQLEEIFNRNYPRCQKCGDLLRPCILMFCDGGWCSQDNDHGKKSYRKWDKLMRSELEKGKKLVILEIGCGKRVPTMRYFSEGIVSEHPSATMIRINPDFPLTDHVGVKDRSICIQSKGLEALLMINEAMRE